MARVFLPPFRCRVRRHLVPQLSQKRTLACDGRRLQSQHPCRTGIVRTPAFPNTCCCDLLHVINSFTGLSHSPISGQYNLYSAAWLVHFTKDEQYWSEANIHLLKRQTMDWSMDALRCFPDGGHHLPILVIVLAVDPVISCAWFQTLQNRFFLAPK